MAQAKIGDTVKVHYTGKLEDGTVFDTSQESDPVQFTIGGGEVIQGFEEAVVGMEPGEKKTASIPADDAYGPRRDEMIVEVSRDNLPEDFEPQVGQQLQVHQPSGQVALVTVKDVNSEGVVLDANHPLAGKQLKFDIQLVAIV
jgi:peptidylprolyl isomerase